MLQQRQNPRKSDKSQVWLLYLDRWRGRTPTKSVYRIQNFKDKREYRLGVLPRTLSPTRTEKTFWLAAMLFCSHAVETTVETGHDLETSSDSKVYRSGLDRPHVFEKISDFKVSTLKSGFKSFRIHWSDSPDACGRKAYPESKVYGFVSMRIRVDRAWNRQPCSRKGFLRNSVSGFV